MIRDFALLAMVLVVFPGKRPQRGADVRVVADASLRSGPRREHQTSGSNRFVRMALLSDGDTCRFCPGDIRIVTIFNGRNKRKGGIATGFPGLDAAPNKRSIP